MAAIFAFEYEEGVLSSSWDGHGRFIEEPDDDDQSCGNQRRLRTSSGRLTSFGESQIAMCDSVDGLILEEEEEDTTDEVETIELTAATVSAATKGPPVTADDFELLQIVGRGAYGKVFLVRKRTGHDAGKYFAMKVLKKASLVVKKKDAEHTRAERSILEQMRHPFIVGLAYAFQTENKLYLIMDFASGGELFTYMEKEGMFMEDIAKFYLAELVLAIEHVHSLGVIYRDLKPENILLHRDGHVCLTDFGLSKVALDSEDGKTTTMCGTIEYMAPETLTRQRYGVAVDWWSLGALAYDMVAGHPPFTSNNRKKTIDMIINGKLKMPGYLTADAADFIKKLLRKTPTTRLGSNGGAAEVKAHRFFRGIDWSTVLARTTLPPVVPNVNGDTDVSNFDKQFTSMPVVDSPADPSQLLSSSAHNIFQGFSYVAPCLIPPFA